MARDILLSLEIRADPSTLFEAITTGEGLASFWTPAATADPTPGSEARFEFAGAPVPLRMQVEKLDAVTRVEVPRRLSQLAGHQRGVGYPAGSDRGRDRP